MNPDDFPEWLRPHLPTIAPSDNTRTRSPRRPSAISPDISRRVNNLTATMGRSAGPRTEGNHPVGFMDIAHAVGNLGRDAVQAVGLPLGRLEDAADNARGIVTQPDAPDYSTLDPKVAAQRQIDAMRSGEGDPLLAAIMPGAPAFRYGPNATILRDAARLYGDPGLYTAAGPLHLQGMNLPLNFWRQAGSKGQTLPGLFGSLGLGM